MGEDGQEQQEEQQAPNGDYFEVNIRVGDATRTLGYAGLAQVNGVLYRWVAEFTPNGLTVNPSPVEGGAWDNEARTWTLADGTVVEADSTNGMLEAVGRLLQDATNAAAAAYEAAITEHLGALPTQRALFL